MCVCKRKEIKNTMCVCIKCMKSYTHDDVRNEMINIVNY